jgi:hypothetical protein
MDTARTLSWPCWSVLLFLRCLGRFIQVPNLTLTPQCDTLHDRPCQERTRKASPFLPRQMMRCAEVGARKSHGGVRHDMPV